MNNQEIHGGSKTYVFDYCRGWSNDRESIEEPNLDCHENGESSSIPTNSSKSNNLFDSLYTKHRPP